MPALELPRTLTLPSRTRVKLLRARTGAVEPREPPPGAPLFAEILELFEDEVRLECKVPSQGRGALPERSAPPARGALPTTGASPRTRGGTRERSIDVLDLPLADFHVLRAVLLKAGFAHEDEEEVECRNCGRVLSVRPCAGLEIGPWEDGELDDPELDRTAEVSVPLDVGPIPIGRVRQARTITLAPRTVRQAMPLFAALSEEVLELDEAVVHAMGIAAIGPVASPRRIAQLLARCDDAAFEAVTNAFLSAHYPPRLACDVFCPSCKARCTVDAPAVREFAFGVSRELETPSGDRPGACPPLPRLEDFVELAHAIAEPLIAEIPGERAQLIVEGGTPAVDDGGEPLLGSYVPPPPKDAPVPTRPPTVTVYYRTFQSMEREEGPYDWEAELRETIEHELEHHVYYLRGDDPMDDAEHAEIDREAVRVIGRGEARRRTIASFGTSVGDFFARAWPLVLIGAVVLVITIAEGRCGP